MIMVDRVGRFKGYPQEWSVRQHDTNGLLQFVCRVSAEEYFSPEDNAWIEWRYGQEITAYIWLEKKDHSPIDKQIKNLMDALGWSGTSWSSLDQDDWSKTKVQFTVEENNYNNKRSLQVSWINPENYEGGGGALAKMDASKLKSLDAVWGPKLRAISGVSKPALPKASSASKSSAPQPVTPNVSQKASAPSPAMMSEPPDVPIEDDIPF